MKFSLPSEIYTLQQLELVAGELTACIRQIEKSAIKEQVSQKKAAVPMPQLSVEAKALLEANQVQELASGPLTELTTQLERLSRTAPQVHLTLAAMPAEGLKKQLAGWLRQNLNPEVLVTFSYHSALLGGMVLRTGSRTFDWSFRRQILAAAPQFAEGLRHV